MRPPRGLFLTLSSRLVREVTEGYFCELLGQLTSLPAGLAALDHLEPDFLVLEEGLSGSEAALLAAAEGLRARTATLRTVLVLHPGSSLLARTRSLGFPRILASPNGRLASQVADALGLQSRAVHRCRTVLLLSLKGGVGKTTLAINLAAAAAQQEGSRVLVADFDWDGPDVATYLGLQPDTLARPGPESSEAWRPQATPWGISLLLPDVSESGMELEGARLRAAVTELRGRFDFLFLDSGPSLRSPEAVSTLHLAEEHLVVTTPSPLALASAARLAHILRDLELQERAGLILNQVREPLDPDAVARYVGLPVVGAVPYDPQVEASLQARSPLTAATGKAARALEPILRRITRPEGG